MAILEVTNKDFQSEVLDSNKPVLVDFYAMHENLHHFSVLSAFIS